jgi:hypothetical protein
MFEALDRRRSPNFVPSRGLSKWRDGRDPLAIGGPFHTKADLM